MSDGNLESKKSNFRCPTSALIWQMWDRETSLPGAPLVRSNEWENYAQPQRGDGLYTHAAKRYAIPSQNIENSKNRPKVV